MVKKDTRQNKVGTARVVKPQKQQKKKKKGPSHMQPQAKRPKTAEPWGMNDLRVSGLSSGSSITNTSTIVDHFSRRTEKIVNLVSPGTTAFTQLLTTANQNGLFINPGNSIMFPIFSQIASNYEQYRVRYLCFHYATEAYAGAQTVASAGKVILVTNFDQSDAAFTTSTQAENYDHMVKGPPFANLQHCVMQKKGASRGFLPLNDYFVNPSGNLSAPTGDSSQGKFYDIGLFQVMCEQLAATGEIGELYVTYEFDMIRPKQSAAGGSYSISHFQNVNSVAASTPLGTPISSGVYTADSGMPLTTFQVLSSTTFALNAIGTYQVVIIWSAASSIASLPSFTPGSSVVADTILLGSTSGSFGYGSGGSFAQAIKYYNVTAVSASPYTNNLVTVGGLSGMAGAANVDVIITQLPYLFTSLPPKVENRVTLIEEKLQALYSRLLCASQTHLIDDNKETESAPGNIDVELLKGQLQELEKRLRDNLFISVRDDTPRIANDTLVENKSRSSSRK
jgi:hypothetical protein